ncbi:hypothetical protein ASE69_18675 [Sphingomonas sp. Leaf208]|nr:hypothetical protein ASE69_18675 [Sphingomonas sp. Leaf208]
MLGQAVQRNLGQQTARLGTRKGCVHVLDPTDRNAALLTAMTKPHCPESVSAWSDTEAEPGKLRVPDDIFRRAGRMVFASKITVQ